MIKLENVTKSYSTEVTALQERSGAGAEGSIKTVCPCSVPPRDSKSTKLFFLEPLSSFNPSIGLVQRTPSFDSA